MQHQAGALTPTTREVFINFHVRILFLVFPRRFGATVEYHPLTNWSWRFCTWTFFHLNMMVQLTHLVSSKSNKRFSVDTVKKKKKKATVTESWLWFQLLLVHLAEFAEAAWVFNVTYIRKAGSSSLPVTVDVSTSTLTHVRPPVMSSLHSPGTTSTSTRFCIWSFFHHIFSFTG